jgi:6-phosphogluconolactonase
LKFTTEKMMRTIPRGHFHAMLAVAGYFAASLSAARAADELVYFGTQTPAQSNAAQAMPSATSERGPFAARLDVRTGHLTAIGFSAAVDRATWVVADPRRPLLYAVSEIGNDGRTEAQVFSLAVERATGRLSILNHSGSGGGGATHLALDPGSNTLFVANYGTGHVASLPVLPDGSLGPAASVLHDEGTGPSPRQAGPHAHSVVVDPTHQFVLTADLGADKVFINRLDARTHQLNPSTPAFESVTPGAGPRHLVFHPNGKFVFLDTELSSEVRSYRWDAHAGQLTLLQTISADAPDHQGTRSAAEIAVARDGRHLYVSNRGENALVVYNVDPATGMLTFAQRIDCGGRTPWSFGLDPTGRWLLVTNQGSSEVAVFRVDASNGQLSAIDETLPVPAPVSVAFLPAR